MIETNVKKSWKEPSPVPFFQFSAFSSAFCVGSAYPPPCLPTASSTFNPNNSFFGNWWKQLPKKLYSVLPCAKLIGNKIFEWPTSIKDGEGTATWTFWIFFCQFRVSLLMGLVLKTRPDPTSLCLVASFSSCQINQFNSSEMSQLSLIIAINRPHHHHQSSLNF